ncbi:Alpha/Beta hydrolase protein [Suillus clintonianus]|uniref:Alpha/Beta hydrolase protein n=1 Tax=Suillus clintonianus TaxID=1904413 RepID=UPI001B883DD5|nr:Alpha/Beta hydrolase protein [Suillus clintonianus]KAG2152883.1 Alpha/Beta hydrolase protein [Suillus clintonianus]
MATVPSASQWGFPTASKRALLIHGLNSSSHTFHRVASALAAKGYLVVAPNLLGHALRKPGADFLVQTLADDLLPYLQAAEYDIVIGHSMGALAVLSLLKYLPKTRPTSVVLIDPSVEVTAEQMVDRRVNFASDVINNPTAEDYMALNPLWTRDDAVWKVLGTHIGRDTNSDDHIDGNVPWSFSHLFADRPAAAALTVLIADPRFCGALKLEAVAKFKDIRTVIVPNASHWIQYEFPEVIVEEALRNIKE